MDLLSNIISLAKTLPLSLPLATVDDRIYTVMTSVEGESLWATFNKWFDALFGEDCRNGDRRLHYMH